MTTPAAAHRSVNPSEVGWQFVPQYYTFVNKQPDRLHQFYTKKSTFMHGTEGDDGKPCLGQQEIHQKITAIGFQDCKVFIHSVDAQSSADGGIIIQVIGEMSNRGEAWRKFVQTFFLAEQPNGYFVLNDIFRFLKEETVDDESTSDAADAEPVSVVEHAAVVIPEPPREPTPPPPPPPVPEREPTPPPVEVVPEPIPEPPAKVATPEPPVVQAAPATPQPNGVHRSVTPATAPTPPVEKAATPSPAPTPAAAPTPPPAAAAAAPPPAPAPTTPAQPKTWANLAAANSKKWGSAVAQDSRGTSEVAPAAPAAPAPPPPVVAPQRSQQGQHPNFIAAMTVTTPQCFVKGVIETVTSPMLTSQLTARFGPMKDLEIVRSKACAFFEFNSLDAARRAIAASLPPSQGGEGGFWVDVGDGQTQRISIETRKERGDRPPSRPRGGAPVGGEGRGRGDFRGGRGRGAAAGAGRGVPAGK